MSHIAKAIHAMQSAGLVCVKHRKNDSLRSSYATLADIWELLRPHLTDHGLAVSFRHGAIREVGAQIVQGMTVRIVHAASGEVEEWAGEYPMPEGNRGVNFAQRFGSATTYAQRYALCAAFGVATGDDDDARRAASQVGRAAGATVSSNPDNWPALMDGAWADAPTPDGTATLGDIDHRARLALWKSNPDHAGLLAYVADWIVGRLENSGSSWAQWTTEAGGTWPDGIDQCSPDELRAAARAIFAASKA